MTRPGTAMRHWTWPSRAPSPSPPTLSLSPARPIPAARYQTWSPDEQPPAGTGSLDGAGYVALEQWTRTIWLKKYYLFDISALLMAVLQ